MAELLSGEARERALAQLAAVEGRATELEQQIQRLNASLEEFKAHVRREIGPLNEELSQVTSEIDALRLQLFPRMTIVG